MPEDQKSSFSEAVETGASAAHTIRGAIKTGKAISSAAKGAAAGGPYGAVAGAVWAGRKHIGKIIVAVIALLMLPVLFVLMLPGLIFGGLTNAFSPSDPEIPILNSETAIIENANEITFTLNGILGEALEDVLARIEADFAASGADHMEVKNAYSGGPIYNANLFISQYCAAKDKDFESISLNDLAATLRENKQHLYSYTSKQEIRENTMTDPETGEETTVSETWMVYTVRYNGESYFSDVVFQLTDDQKELASDYASNLSLFLGDGLLQNLEAWTGNSITALGDVTFTDGITPVVYYNQLDERYAGKAYGTDNIGGYGCGPTAMAIVVSSLPERRDRLGALSGLCAFFLICLPPCSAAGTASSALLPPTMRRFRRYFMKISRKEERLSPEIPISATNAAGSAVRHKAMIRAVRPRGSNEKTGTPMANARMPASITLRALNIPPKKVPDSMKFGGIM